MKKITKFWYMLFMFVPRPLPTGRKEFDSLSNRVLSICGDYASKESMRFALANHILHLGPLKAVVSDFYFVISMRKAAANEAAYAMSQEIKEAGKRKLEQEKAEEDKLKLERENNERVIQNSEVSEAAK